MIDIISHTIQVAKKEYFDDGWELVSEWNGYVPPKAKITFADKRLLVKWRNNYKAMGRIYPGQSYVRQFNKMDGDTYTWRTKKEVYDFCSKFSLFDEY